ncbi:glycosyltransferase family 4 protein [Niveispirillum irakense]|uniref:glycosyltransferase family 4 protein n=1 Tax=Niveispirillum irakense TaxID=34011 RepID=UPI00041182A5|nr:glycosyltransferase family 1 protein [Niveispirillum irakense]
MGKPTVVFDHHTFSSHRFGGVSRYFAKLIGNARRDERLDIVTPFRYVQNEHLLHEEPERFRAILGNRPFRGQGRLLHSVNRLLVGRTLRRGRFDLLHPTSYDPWFLPDLGTKPFVLTVYDLIHELYADRFTAAELAMEDKRPLLARAAHIITISDSTKADLIRLHNVAADKITTIHLGGDHVIDDARSAGSLPVPALPDRYVLFVGTRGRYKNFDRCAAAVASLMVTRPDLHLVCVGGGPLKAAELAPFAGMAGRVHQMNLHDSQMQAVYSRAALFVFPSLYEGFGLPLVEAAFCGCPVACSDRSSLPEVGGDAALYFDPERVDDMADVMGRLLDDTALHAEMRRRGSLRAQDFTWRHTTAQTIGLYKQIV